MLLLYLGEILFQRPERSGFPSAVRGAGAARLGFPSAVRGRPGVRWFSHWPATEPLHTIVNSDKAAGLMGRFYRIFLAPESDTVSGHVRACITGIRRRCGRAASGPTR